MSYVLIVQQNEGDKKEDEEAVYDFEGVEGEYDEDDPEEDDKGRWVGWLFVLSFV